MIIKNAEDEKQWNEYVESHKEANFLQSWQWGEFHKSRGDIIIRRAIFDDKKIVGVYEGVVEDAKRGRYFEIAGGPILDWQNKETIELFRDDIEKQAKKNRCVFVRVRPQLELNDFSVKLFEKIGFKKAPMYLSVEYAGILNLDKSEEEILKGMRQRLRRALRKAEKNNIIVEKSTDPEKIREFYNIQLSTATRHSFIPFSEDFLYKQFKAFSKTGNATLYIAKYNDQILAENFMIFYGNEASYHYGVSTELGTKLSGAPLLHMEAMRDARKRGISRYNLWGIVDETDTKHRFYGVSVFKRGFGVDEYKYLPAQDLIIDKMKYPINWLVETVRRKIRHV
jgi:lipid II:glycine glycyltransferase (peptidoglycan interpeptide bridge formation enzyme)